MNERKHWNRIGSDYHSEIFDVFASDRLKKLPAIFQRRAGKNKDAIDFGCGIGRAFEYLSPAFKSVLALDISDELLSIARTSRYKNITYKRHDLTKPLKAKADFGFCCNVIMLPEVDKNLLMLKGIRACIRKGGSVAIVLPSLDSFFYSALRMIEWYKKEGTPSDQIDASELGGFKGSKPDLIQGLVRIDGVKTKHFSLPELELMFAKAGFINVKIDRLEYDWTTEFSSPPKWMKEPYPWDWVVEAEVD